MLREKFKWRPHENESTDAGHGGGVARSSDEGSVMGLERRGYIVRLYLLVNQQWEEPMSKARPMVLFNQRLDDRSRMTGDCHVRICGSVGVRFPRATRLYTWLFEPSRSISA